jgi:ATP-dependent helicase/nuclease subunit A
MRTTPSDQQVAAIEEPGVVFVSAGAGTGKTTVLVERFVKAVCERGLGIDNVLVITYTERTAGELRTRIRERLVEVERHDLARDLDGGWISTIHGFCHRLLRAHPFEAGLDPRFRVLDESQAAVLRAEAFAEALARYVEAAQAERVRLLATYGAEGLRGMLTNVYDRLRSAGRPLELPGEPVTSLAERVAELCEVAEVTLRVTEEALPGRAQVDDALQLLDPVPPAEDLLDLSDLRVGGGERERFASFGEALTAVEYAALDEIAARDRTLLEELLGTFDAAYSEAKARESALDFEDLQLRARNLLQLDKKVRDDARWRFRSILVDEFQDTNRLQCELVDLVAGDEVFFVGDEFQSIYRFRHADVEVFRERRAASAGGLPLTENYRSRPEVLDVVNHLFGAEFGTEYEPLVAAGRFPDPLFGPAVELLVTDKASYREGDLHWRIAEARHVARRVRELVDSGQATPGEIVLLFAAGTDAERYEEALRLEDLPTYRAAGRGYFGQQQVADLTMYLRLILNRYDDEALVSVLASPFVGVSNDALYLLRRAAGRRPLFSGMERDLPAELGPRDRRLFEAFRQSACASGSSPSTTTTSPFSRAGTGAAATRTSASSHAWRAPTRNCAARTSRVFSASSPTRRPRAPARARPSPRRKAGTRCASSPSTPRRASSSRSSSWPTRDGIPSMRRATRSSAFPTGGSGSRSSTPPRASATPHRASTSCERPSAWPTRPRRAASTTSR